VNLPRRRSSVYAVRDNSSLHWRLATNEYARNAGDSRRVGILKIPKIYIILRFPIIAYLVYEIIKITPIPIHDCANVFTLIKTTYHLLVIDKENRCYLLLDEHDLKECIQDDTHATIIIIIGRSITCKKMHRAKYKYTQRRRAKHKIVKKDT